MGWESWDFFFFLNGCRLLSKQGLYAPFLHLYKIYAACILSILQKLEGDPPVSAIDINQICKNVLTVKNRVRDSSHFFYPFLSRPKLIFKGILSNHLNWGSNQTHFEVLYSADTSKSILNCREGQETHLCLHGSICNGRSELKCTIAPNYRQDPPFALNNITKEVQKQCMRSVYKGIIKKLLTQTSLEMEGSLSPQPQGTGSPGPH